MRSSLANKNSFTTIILIAIAFFLCTLLLTLHRHFTFYSSYDQGIFNQVFWNGIHGRFFQSSLSSQLSTNVVHSGEVPDVSYHRLGQHFTPALLLWLPIYYLFPYPATLNVLQVIFITTAGLLLYVLARIYLESSIAILITISFYCANAVLGPTLSNFHDISQIPLFVFGLLLAMEKRCWWIFWLLGICILAVREDSGITLFGIGMYLIVSRRYPKVGFIVCSLSFLYTIALTNLIMPLFSDDISKRFMLERFGQYAEGNEASTIDILWGMISNPLRLIVELFTPFWETVKYFLGHWLPLAFIPVVSPVSWIIAGFPLLKLLLGQGQTVLSISVRYAMSVVPGLFYGVILWWAGVGFNNFGRKRAEYKPRKLYPKFRKFWIFCICLSVFFTITSNPSQTLYFLIPDSLKPLVHVSLKEQWKRTPEIQSLISFIPKDKSVSATTHIIPHLSSRRVVLRLPKINYQSDNNSIETVDYLVADLWRIQRYGKNSHHYRKRLKSVVELIDSVIEENKYNITGFKDGVVLLEKGIAIDSKLQKAWDNYRNSLVI